MTIATAVTAAHAAWRRAMASTRRKERTAGRVTRSSPEPDPVPVPVPVPVPEETNR